MLQSVGSQSVGHDWATETIPVGNHKFDFKICESVPVLQQSSFV